jgi:uncharacterized membrane protein YhaH (DUF805 family)
MLTDNFKSNFNFDGTATRSEYWGVILITWLIAWAAIIVIETSLLGALVGLVACIASIWAMIAVTMKRCRDCGLNTWWTAATFIPIVGWIVMTVIGVLGQTQGESA